MSAPILALLPVFLLIVSGFALRRSRFLPDDFWPACDRLTYFILFPALLVHTLATARLEGVAIGAMAMALIIPMLAITLVLMILRRSLRLEGPAFTSVFQGAIRPNTYVGLACAFALFGPNGLSLAAVAVAAMVPLANFLSAIILSFYANNNRPTGWKLAALVARNPLILSCLAGALLNASGIGLPSFSEPFLGILGRAALTLGLLSVGAALNFEIGKKTRRALAWAVGAKLFLFPLIAVPLLGLWQVGGEAAAVTILFAALPASATGFVMARQMGGDHGLMAKILTAQVITAIATLPLILIMFT